MEFYNLNINNFVDKITYKNPNLFTLWNVKMTKQSTDEQMYCEVKNVPSEYSLIAFV